MPTGGNRLPIVPRASTSCTTKIVYFQSLDAVACVRCQEKLTLLGLSVSEDPYELWSKEKFVKSMSLWPPVEYGHIFCYFLFLLYKKELTNWKSLEAYNYFQKGRVRLVKVFQARSCSILMELVNPSHRRVAPRNSIKYGRTQLEATKTCSSQTFPCSIVHTGSSDTERPSKVNLSNTGNRIQALKIRAHGGTASRSSRHYRQMIPTSRRACQTSLCVTSA